MTNTAYNVDNFETLADDLALVHRKGLVHRRPAYRCARAGAVLLRAVLARVSHLAAAFAAAYRRHTRVFVLYSISCCLRCWPWWLVQLRRRCGLRAAVWFAVSQLAVSVWRSVHRIRCSISPALLIAYAGCAWVLAKPRRSDDAVLRRCWCWARRQSFCDLLVTPIITLGLPLDLLAAGTPAAPAGRRAAVRPWPWAAA